MIHQNRDKLTQILTDIENNLPPVFSRKKAAEALGGLITAKTLSNLDARKEGPPKVNMGSKVGYERDGFIDWLKVRLKV